MATPTWDDPSRLFDGLPAPTSIITPAMTIGYANERAGTLVGVEGQELVGTPLVDWIHPADAPMFLGQIAAAMTGDTSSATGTVRLRGATGWQVIVYGATSLADHPLGDGVLIFGDPVDSTSCSTIQLDRSDEISVALACLAHELRDPLTAIRVFAHTASSRPDADDECVRCAQRFVDNAEELSDRFDGALDALEMLNGVDQGTGEVNLHEVVAEAILAVTSGGRAGAVVTNGVAERLVVRTNAQVLRVCIARLVENALEHGSPGRVSVEASQPTGNEPVAFHVIDSGPGIAREDIARMYERVRDSASGTGGRGLGLWLTRVLIERMGHLLSVRSTADGTCFSVVFESSAPV